MRHDNKMDRNCRVVMTVAKMSAPNSLMSIRIKICATEKKKKAADRESHTNSGKSAP